MLKSITLFTCSRVFCLKYGGGWDSVAVGQGLAVGAGASGGSVVDATCPWDNCRVLEERRNKCLPPGIGVEYCGTPERILKCSRVPQHSR